MRKLVPLTASNQEQRWHNVVNEKFVDKWIDKLRKQGYTHFTQTLAFEDIGHDRLQASYSLSLYKKVQYLNANECKLFINDEQDAFFLKHPRLGMWMIGMDGVDAIYARMVRAEFGKENYTDAQLARALLRFMTSGSDRQ